MARDSLPGRMRVYQGPLFPRVESGNLLAPDEVAARITNMAATPDGSLKSIVGPTPYLPWLGVSGSDWFPQTEFGPASGPLVDLGLSTEHNYFEDYGDTHGVHHAVIGGGTREILLLHTGNEIWSFEGWERGWRVLLGPKDSTVPPFKSAEYSTAGIMDTKAAQPPTQFETAPNGVIIVPQGDRAYFYDGVVVAPLGYSTAPGAPQGLGPRSSSPEPQSFRYLPSSGEAYFKNPWTTTALKDQNQDNSDVLTPMRNDVDFAHDAQRGFYEGYPAAGRRTSQHWIPGVVLTTGMHPAFGRCYVGTVSFPAGMTPLSINTQSNGNSLAAVSVPSTVGVLLEGEYYGAAQWIDRWGNLSPVSKRSNPIRFDRQVSAGVQIIGSQTSGYGQDNRRHCQVPGAGELVAKQIGWTAIEPGPPGTIGRILYRTRDTYNSGTNELLELPPNASGGTTAYATLPDNISKFYADNVADARLRNPAPELVPVPKFKLCRIALGRLWITGIENAPGMIRPSLPGRWGTFPANQEIFPDPRAGDMTGLWSSPNGLLAFTKTSTYLVTSRGDSFETRSLSSTVGCVAPSSIAEMSGGTLVWLGVGGFYQIDSPTGSPQLISGPIGNRLKNLNLARSAGATAEFDPVSGEYRCWVAIDGTSHNSVCFAYDGEGWRERTDMYEVTDVCVTQNHQSHMIVCGRASGTAQYRDVKAGTTAKKTFFGKHGVWVLDHENHTWIPEKVVPSIETSWIGAGSSQQRKSVIRAYLWLRETQKPAVALTESAKTPGVAIPALALQVSVYTDWRKKRTISGTVVATPVSYASMYPEEDPPPAWEQESWATNTETWKRRRPFWVKVEISVPSCEVFKLRMEPTEDPYRFEFIGLSFDMIARPGARMSKVTETI